MRVGSLFSGGGLGDLGFSMAGCEIVFQCEIDEYCQKILALRYPDAVKFRDIREVKGADLPIIDILTGGFPCQDISFAGAGAGIDPSFHWRSADNLLWLTHRCTTNATWSNTYAASSTIVTTALSSFVSCGSPCCGIWRASYRDS